jgi:hypothetical protein
MPFFSKRPPLSRYSDDLTDDAYGLATYWTWLMPVIVMSAFVVTAVLCR